MKTLFALVGFIVLLTPAYAETSHDDTAAPEEIVGQIRAGQNLEETAAEVDCSRVEEDNLEELGEAVMSLMHPDPEQHELMDRMMGGEGSDSLRTMHVMMGLRYLGCDSGTMPHMTGAGGMMGMNHESTYNSGANGNMVRGDNSLGHVEMRADGMMRAPGYQHGAWHYGWLIIALLLGIVVVVIVSAVTTLAILRKRYPAENGQNTEQR